jgi:hypothetical protein
VDRHPLAAIDKGRIYLPCPTPLYGRTSATAPELVGYEVTRWETRFARLIHYVEHREYFYSALDRAGFNIVEHLSE